MKSIFWRNNGLVIIDQTLLPARVEYLFLSNPTEVIEAIRKMCIRGAPALAIAAAFALFLGIRNLRARSYIEFRKDFDRIKRSIASSRPTAINLFWALERMSRRLEENKEKSVREIKRILFKEAKDILEENRSVTRQLSKIGAQLIKDNDRILTICNTGILATVDYGTALGVIYEAKRQKKSFKVFACETRPLLQGARLTAWELKQNKIDVTLICDGMAGYLMQKKLINKVIVGADRIVLNGDTANKIGTYNLAVLCRYHKIPFFVAAPLSSFDLSIKNGDFIPIEERDPREVTHLFFKKPIAPEGIKVFNPAFDITPHRLITCFITEKGIIKPPFKKNIKKIYNENQ
ncbi:MAG: S-methyl-5-thioribose-1-phosphate isomerase [Candidatus Omnitrophica bacterium]|nr:S-methyl-5-thioribose-1-phosphate isomerase [Candidatus Omnitrophota bacterium]